MNEVTGDLWSYYTRAYIVIPTNGYIKANGCNVMGRGVAAQAARRFPSLPLALGTKISRGGSHVFVFKPIKLITFPVKHSWWDNADPQLIINSVNELKAATVGLGPVYLPRVGCGNGSLNWDLVKPVLMELDDQFTVVSHPKDL